MLLSLVLARNACEQARRNPCRFADFAGGNDTASLHITLCLRNSYRDVELFLFDAGYHWFLKKY